MFPLRLLQRGGIHDGVFGVGSFGAWCLHAAKRYYTVNRRAGESDGESYFSHRILVHAHKSKTVYIAEFIDKEHIAVVDDAVMQIQVLLKLCDILI